MKVVLQRVKEASVTVDDKIIGKIGKGYLLFIGLGKEDSIKIIDKYIDKIVKLRIFEDSEGKTNLSLNDVGGEVLAVSQFTLYADCKKGNRPNFLMALEPNKAAELFEYCLEALRKQLGKVESGEFGADMKISLVNDGPFTIVLDESTFM